jgi:hypothetical protein
MGFSHDAGACDMTKRALCAIALLQMVAASADAQQQQQNYPFVGRWDCEVATFTFTNTTYNNGSETMRMTKVEKKGNIYILTFPKNYRIGLSSISATRMTWASETTGDGFNCKRVK